MYIHAKIGYLSKNDDDNIEKRLLGRYYLVLDTIEIDVELK